MNLLESLAVAMEGLLANKLRSVLTMLGVIIGVGAVIIMLAIGQGAREQTLARIQSMGTNVLMVMPGQSRNGAVRGGFGSVQSLTLADADALPQKCSTVAKAAPNVQQNLQVKYRNQNTSTNIVGVTPDYLTVRNYAVQDGRFITTADQRGANRVAVIGPTTMANLFPAGTSPVGKDISIKGIRFTIVGLLASKGAGAMGDEDDLIFIPISTAMRRVMGLLYVRSISVQAQSMDDMDEATSQISQLLRKRHHLSAIADDDFIIRNQQQFIDMASQQNNTFTLLLACVASVSLLVGGIGIMNIMLVSVTERTREIGIRKALGARRKDVLSQFLIEAVVLSLLGGTTGILFGLTGSWGLGVATGWNVAVSALSVIISFGFSAFVGIVFGLYPAYQASRLDPIEALRYE